MSVLSSGRMAAGRILWLPHWYSDDTCWSSVPTCQGYSPCTEQDILGCATALDLMCHPDENVSCLWGKHIPYLKLSAGAIREVRAKPQEINSLKRASPIQIFFFSLALSHSVIPCVWLPWLFDVYLIHSGNSELHWTGSLVVWCHFGVAPALVRWVAARRVTSC